jgi:epoxyqueuosine reductase QueG
LRRDPNELRRTYERLYVPKNDGTYLHRNAIVALGNTGSAGDRDLLEPFLNGDDELLREHAEWAAAQLVERDA